MDEYTRTYGNPTIDFADFDIETPDNQRISTHQAAQTLALCLATYTSIDDYHAPDDWSTNSPWITTVGTGGGGMHIRLATQGYQRSVLASHFASYGSCQYNSCYLALPEYRCLQQLHIYLTEEYNPSNHWGEQKQFDQQMVVLEQTLKEFRNRYAKVDKGFLLEILKTLGNKNP